jgi:hypothetical protein
MPYAAAVRITQQYIMWLGRLLRTNGSRKSTGYGILTVEQPDPNPEVKAGIEGREVENGRGIETRFEQT